MRRRPLSIADRAYVLETGRITLKVGVVIFFMMSLFRRLILRVNRGGFMENFVITIARQYGSGGRTVGKMLAEKLGVSFYDKRIIQMVSMRAGLM